MDQHTLQRHRNRLITCGFGIILFGFLDILQTITICLYGNIFFNLPQETVISQKTFKIIVFVIVFVFLLFSLGLKIFIGRSAIREGRGFKVRHFYFLACIISIVFFLANIAFIVYILLNWNVSTSFLDYVGGVLRSVINLLILGQILHSAVVVKKYSDSSLLLNN